MMRSCCVIIFVRLIREGITRCYCKSTISFVQRKQHKEVTDYLSPKEEACLRLIKRTIIKTRFVNIEELIQSLQNDKFCSIVPLTSQIVDNLLSKFGDDWKSALCLFEWARLKRGHKHTPYACNKMIDLLGKMRQLDRMWDLLHELHSSGSVTLETIAKSIRRLVATIRWKDAIALFDKLESMGFERNSVTMNLLLDALCKENKVEVAHEALLVLGPHIPPDAYTFNIFVHGWCIAQRIDEALWTVEEMKRRGIKPSVITFSTILQAYCQRGDFQKVYAVLDLMLSENCTPNIVTYTTIMNSLAKFGRHDEALYILEKARAAGCQPDVLFYNSLINILGKGGKLCDARRTYEIDMHVNGVARNLITYNTMISVYCYNNQGQNALVVLKELEESGHKPDLQTYRPFIRLCFSSADWSDPLQRLLKEISDKHNLSLDLDTYTLLIHGLCRAGDVEWACRLFDEMVGCEIMPRNKTCDLLMNEGERKNMNAYVDSIRSMARYHPP